ncbi:Uncharacterised protein [Neisseria meningitidis]|nr:Uncharacterised protein [Neisseria meningitidis]
MAVEGGALGVESAGKPSGGNGLGGLVNHLRLVAFDDTVVIGEEEEGFGIRVLRRADGGADGADVVAQMRDAGGGYAGQNSFFAHKNVLAASMPSEREKDAPIIPDLPPTSSRQQTFPY